MSVTPPEPDSPVVDVAYAPADGIHNRPPPKSPRWPLRFAVVGGVLLSLLLLATLVDANGSILGATLPAWPISIVVLISAAIAVRRNVDARLSADERRPGARVWGVLAFSIIVLLAHTGLASRALHHIRLRGKSVITMSNLRVLSSAIQQYSEAGGDWPTDFDVLVTTGLVFPWQLVSHYDPTPAALNPTSGPPCYTSFVYRPGVGKPIKDRDLVIAFERMPWSPRDTRLFTKWARWVLLGDGQVVLLDDNEFKDALRRDAERRRALGWPALPAP